MRSTIQCLLFINLFFLIEFKISSHPSESIFVIIINIFFIIFMGICDNALKNNRIKRGNKW